MMQQLLLATDPPAVEIVNPDGHSHALLICDHASNRIPQQLGHLGLKAADLDAHISWDPGAAEVARHLSQRLDATLILSAYSRLVIDCNRSLASSESIPDKSAGVTIKGNQRLTARQKKNRIDELYAPYHRTIDNMLEQRSNRQTIVLSIHSFTPMLNATHRPWHISIAYDKDRRLAALLIRALARDKDIRVGENEPYPIEDDIDYTLPQHAAKRGLLHVMIEIRQDMITTKTQAMEWAIRLAQAYHEIEAEALLC